MAFFRARSTMLLSIRAPACRRKASTSSSDSADRRSLCPARSSVLFCAPPTAPPSTHAALSSTARFAPDGSAAVVPATWPVLAPARRDDKRRAVSPTHNGTLQGSCPPPPPPAVFHERG